MSAIGEVVNFFQFGAHGLICPTLKTQLCIIHYVLLGQNRRRVNHSFVSFKWLIDSSLLKAQKR